MLNFKIHKICVVSSSYGNDSVALIQFIKDLQDAGLTSFSEVIVTYCDTGWAAPSWEERLNAAEQWVTSLGFTPLRIKSIGMEELVRIKKGFPANQFQFCTAHLKGIPFLTWIDEYDKDANAVVCVGKRRAESLARANTAEFVEKSEHHGGRLLWHPLYLFSNKQRDNLVAKTPMPVLPHRSQECSPCVNANREDFKLLTPSQIEKVCALEVEIGKPMFRAKKFGALGIHGVMMWAYHGKRRENLEPDEIAAGSGCDGNFGCGL